MCSIDAGFIRTTKSLEMYLQRKQVIQTVREQDESFMFHTALYVWN